MNTECGSPQESFTAMFVTFMELFFRVSSAILLNINKLQNFVVKSQNYNNCKENPTDCYDCFNLRECSRIISAHLEVGGRGV